MDNFNWLILELLSQQRERQLAAQPPALPEQRNGHRGVRHALASTFVRLGLRLDPAAGEGLGAFDLSPASGRGARQRA